MNNQKWVDELWRRVAMSARAPMTLRYMTIEALCYFLGESQRSRQ